MVVPRLQVAGDKITFELDGHTALQLMLATADEPNPSANAEVDANLPAIIYQYVRPLEVRLFCAHLTASSVSR